MTATDLPDADTRAYIAAERTRARRALYAASIPPEHADGILTARQVAALESVDEWLDTRTSTLILLGPSSHDTAHVGWAALSHADQTGYRVFGATVADLIREAHAPESTSPIPRLALEVDLFLFDRLDPDGLDEQHLDWIREVIDERTTSGKRHIITTGHDARSLGLAGSFSVVHV